jgi:hypothetical protein
MTFAQEDALLVDGMDGVYFLVSPAFDSDEPPVPENVGSLDIAVAPEIVGISTYGSWAPVDITIEKTPLTCLRNSWPDH